MSTKSYKFGTLTELACVGMADKHFIDGASHHMFRKEFKQHGNCAIDWNVRSSFQGSATQKAANVTCEGDLLIGGMIVVDQSHADVKKTAAALENMFASDRSPVEFYIGNQCIQVSQVSRTPYQYSRYLNTDNRMVDPTKLSTNTYRGFDETGATNDAEVAFFFDLCFNKEQTPLSLHGKQQLSIKCYFNGQHAQDDDVDVYLQTMQVYVPKEAMALCTQPCMHPIVQNDRSITIGGVIAAGQIQRYPLRYNLPLFKMEFDSNSDLVFRLNVNNNTRFEMKGNIMKAMNSFFNQTDGIHFGLPNHEGFGGAFNMSRCDRVVLEIENNTTNTITLATQTITASAYNILKYEDEQYTLMYSD